MRVAPEIYFLRSFDRYALTFSRIVIFYDRPQEHTARKHLSLLQDSLGPGVKTEQTSDS